MLSIDKTHVKHPTEVQLVGKMVGINAFNERYEAIDIVEEGNYKAQSQLKEGNLYVPYFNLIANPSNRKEEAGTRGTLTKHRCDPSRFQKRLKNVLSCMSPIERRMSSGI